MSRRAKRPNLKRKKKEYVPPTVTERIIILGFGLILVIGSLYLGLRSNNISEDELQNIKVTLTEEPEFDVYQIKSTTYRDIILRTKEHNREFKITGITYESTDKEALKKEIKKGDIIELKLFADDIDEIDDNSYFNNYNTVYGVIKGTKSYVNLSDREELSDNDSSWAFGFTALGLIFIPYGLIKRKPIISIETAVYSLVFVGLIIILFVAYG
jgi:hypothetical protein